MHSANMAREDAKIYDTQDKHVNNKKTYLDYKEVFIQQSCAKNMCCDAKIPSISVAYPWKSEPTMIEDLMDSLKTE